MKTEDQIDGQFAKDLRKALGLSQAQFWKPLGVQQSVASRYEGNFSELPQSVRILIVANYVSGLKIDAKTFEGVQELAKLGSIQSAFQEASTAAAIAREQLDHAAHQIQQARTTLAGI
jgi:transcriptional regulator with XRE-family HTH domain